MSKQAKIFFIFLGVWIGVSLVGFLCIVTAIVLALIGVLFFVQAIANGFKAAKYVVRFCMILSAMPTVLILQNN